MFLLRIARPLGSFSPVPLRLSKPSVWTRTKMTGPHFYSGSGDNLTQDAFLEGLRPSSKRLLLVGENHMDPEAHALELDILKWVHSECGKGGRKLALSLEFYDRQAQPVMNEYLGDFLSEETFLSDANAPGNASDYQPLINYCKEFQLPVIAANCPRRYTSMVSKYGRNKLSELVQACPSSSAFLPPIPYEGASEKYKANFIEIMRSIGNNNARVPTSMLDAQSLWDATMAHSLAQGLDFCDVIIHVTGFFHIKQGLGILEHLNKYLSHPVESVSVVIMPEEDPSQFKPGDHEQMGDFVVLTDLNQI
ncbi:hypothetical protein TCAL_11959 [Tigriopus californicus]|uniref:Haem-binding uptake Tiki superfamily ChaN domain-containing protein n=1 Tax=Tigriopus californicus TaxID=6832 RepID=A0A553NDD3_TIGCA|nr:uncharacterized protein LOC131888425 [Tigriopus californicus]TRY63466.1 hypothetical protein TCAL_11959 [Tigriopus californicus]|eukprot:TCALIF_11959-PA protein Name:"Protein of unknown function" AED:0.04 eAED:0.04 QI:763/1/1/1/0.5/0.4/5/90/306